MVVLDRRIERIARHYGFTVRLQGDVRSPSEDDVWIVESTDGFLWRNDARVQHTPFEDFLDEVRWHFIDVGRG